MPLFSLYIFKKVFMVVKKAVFVCVKGDTAERKAASSDLSLHLQHICLSVEPVELFAAKMEEPLELMIPTAYSHHLPLYSHTYTHFPAKRSLLLLKVVFHVSSTLLDKKAECDSRAGEKYCNKVHLCLPAGGSWWEPNPQCLNISIIDVV